MGIGNGIREIRRAGLLLLSLSLIQLAPAASVRGLADRSGDAKAAGRYGQLPLSFEENRGQTDPAVRYMSRGAGYTLFLTQKDAVLSLTRVDRDRKASRTAVRFGFDGSKGATSVTAENVLPGRTNYLSGQDKSKWLTGIEQFGKVTYKGIYPGVDAVFYGNQRELEYDLIVSPGADPKQIRLKFEGVDNLSASSDGSLVLKTALGNLEQRRPVVYQVVNGLRQEIKAKYVIRDSAVTFDIARYDRRLPLIIDPVIQWSTFLGGTGVDSATAIAVDSMGSAYVVGFTSSGDFPATLRFLGQRGGAADAFIVKYAANGATAAYSTFLSGEGNDQALAVAVDSTGAAYVAGLTDSTKFPVMNPLQTGIGGGQDGFIAKLNPAGDTLVFSTYVGGLNSDQVNDIKVDSNNSAVYIGTTTSSNLIPNGVFTGGTSDAFYGKVAPDTSSYLFRSYLGSADADFGNGVAVDSSNNIYLTGRTNGFSFRSTSGVFQPAIAALNQYDAFVVKLGPAGDRIYSTFLGGTAFDEATSIAADNAGNAYVFGITESANFPTTAPFRAANAGNRDTFVTKINPTATARVYSTYLGGSGVDNAQKIAVNPTTGVAFVTGYTTSVDFPVVNAFQAVSAGGVDSFVTEIAANGQSLNSSSYLGGSLDEQASGIAIDGANNIYLAGTTTSFNFPLLAPSQSALLGTQDAFVTKLSNCTVTLAPLLGGVPGRSHNYFQDIGNISVTATSDCSYIAQSNVSWITLRSGTQSGFSSIPGSGNATITYDVQANSGPPRTGVITIANQQFTVQQAGAPIPGGGCLYDIPQTDIFTASGGSRTFTAGVSGNCPYTISANVPWIQVFPPSGSTTQTIYYTIYPNYTTAQRSGLIQITDGVTTKSMTVSQAQSGLSEIQRFVTLIYFNFLGRYPSQTEIDFQTGALLQGLSRADLVMNFLNSDEFNLSGRFVAGTYVGLLNRNPEFGGWLFQRNALATGGINQNSLVRNFINSQEFFLQNGALDNASYVSLLYRQILGRVPSQAERDNQVAALNAGLSRDQLASNFLNSAEFRLGTLSRLNAFLLYATLLGRSTSEAELIARRNQLDSGVSLRSLVADFIASPEFMLQLQ